MNMHFDSFSGKVAYLKPTQRTEAHVLAFLAKFPRVSVWDMSELAWLRNIVNSLRRDGLIADTDEPYPWCRYELTEKGKAVLAGVLR